MADKRVTKADLEERIRNLEAELAAVTPVRACPPSERPDVAARGAVSKGCVQTPEHVRVSGADITHRKQIEQALAESEKQYRTLFDSAGDAIFILDLQGRFMQVNKTACNWLGYKRGELLAMGLADINAPDARSQIPELLARMARTEELVFETRHITRQGRELPMEINARLIDFQGQPAILSMARDISERARDRALRELTARILNRLNQLTGDVADIEDVLRIIQNATGVEALALRLQQGADYEYFATVGFDADFVEKEHSLCAAGHEAGGPAPCATECLCGFVAQSRTLFSDLPGVTPHGTLWTNSLKGFVDQAHPRDLPKRLRLTCLYEGFESLALIPLKAQSQVIGLMQLNDRRPDMFSDKLIGVFEEIAGGIAIAVQKERVRRALMESEERFRTISIAAQDAIVMMDAQGCITFWNPAAVRLFGHPEEQALGRDLHDILSPGQYHEAARRGLKNFAATGLGSVIGDVLEVQARHACGRQFPVELSISSIRISGQWHAVGIIRDITERKQAEEELRRHRDHLEEMVHRRTRELTVANEQLQDLSRTTITMQEEERARLSRELHDQLGQQLTALTLELEWIRESMGEGGHQLKPLTGMVGDMATEVRRICKGLRPMILDRMGLASAITAHVKEFREHTDLDVRCDVAPMNDLEVDATTAISVFRILQEALNNAAKYSRARRVDVAFDKQQGELVLCVEDDGVGIDQDLRRHQGLGMAGMRERAALCGGRLAITSVPGQGTKIEMRVPGPRHGDAPRNENSLNTVGGQQHD